MPRNAAMISRVASACCLALLLVACATQPPTDAYSAPGFFMGLIHGIVSPLALIVGFFSEIRVYSFPNAGWWYDFGFMLGLTAWAGGGATAAAQ